jgi:oxygen-dependent protoporphyrinogen oxidase
MPASPKAVLSPVVSWRGKLRAAAEPFVTAPDDPEDESLDTFLRRRLGDEAGRLAAWLAAAGVFAGDPARLSARSAFPALAGMEESAGSLVRAAMRRRRERPHGAPRARTYVPFGGMAAVARAAASFLGDRFRPGFEVAAVSRDGDGWVVEGADDLAADHVVLACRPARAADLLGGDIAAVLRRAVSAPVVVVGLGGKAGRLPIPPGFGALAGPDAGTVSLGVLFESSYAPDRAPIGHSLVKVVAGGATRPEVAGWDDDRIVTEVGTEVARMLGHDLEVGFGGVVRHDPGIPQYPVGHGAWLADVENLRRSLPGLHLTGWGYRGVGVANLATDARAVAGKITGVAGRG